MVVTQLHILILFPVLLIYSVANIPPLCIKWWSLKNSLCDCIPCWDGEVTQEFFG